MNNIKYENKSTNKTNKRIKNQKYSPQKIPKRPKSYNKKQKSSSKRIKSNKRKNLKKNNKESEYKEDNYNFSEKEFSNKKKSNKKSIAKGKTNNEFNNNKDDMIKEKKSKDNAKLKKKVKNKNSNFNNINNIIDDINEFNDNINEKIETIENKKVAIKTLINDYKIIDAKDETSNNTNINTINNNQTNKEENSLSINRPTNSNTFSAFEKMNFKTKIKQESQVNSIIINNTNKIINNTINSNYLTNIIISPEHDRKDTTIINNINNNIIKNLQFIPKQIHNKVYGKIINNKRVIFGLSYGPKKDPSPPKLIKKRKRRRLKNILNFNKYQEKIKEMSNNLINNNEFRYIFQSNHKIAKNYFHVKIDIISPRKYNGNKSQKSGSEDSIPKLKIGRKRGRRRRKHVREEEIDDFEISSISKLKKNLKKTDGDMELLFNKSSVEKSSRTKSPQKQNIKSTEISSQNISKEHKNKAQLENNKKMDIEIREEFNNHNNSSFESNNNKNSNNDDMENLEFFSLTSTPEAKKRLRNNFNNTKYYPDEQRIRRKHKKRKNREINSNDGNKSNYNDSQFSINILNDEKNQDYDNMDVDVDLSNSYYDNKNKNN